VGVETDIQVVSKSPNKHNRIYLRAEPMGQELCDAIDKGEIAPTQDLKIRARALADDFKWDVDHAKKIWSFGSPPEGLANLWVDTTKGVQYLSEIKDAVCSAFQQVTLEGILAHECLRGVRINLEDVVMHADAIHRGAGQIMPPTKRAIYAAQLRSGAKLLEPLYRCDITVPNQAIAGVYTTLSARRAVVEGSEEQKGAPVTKIIAFVPVLESFGFTQLLRQNTSGQAFPVMIFDHWEAVNGDCLDETSQAYSILAAVRERKGMKKEMPKFNDYYDKL
jgi:elongation factor 2